MIDDGYREGSRGILDGAVENSETVGRLGGIKKRLSASRSAIPGTCPDATRRRIVECKLNKFYNCCRNWNEGLSVGGGRAERNVTEHSSGFMDCVAREVERV